MDSALQTIGAHNATFDNKVQNGAGEWKNVKDFIADDVRWGENDNVAKWQKAVRDGKHINICSSTRTKVCWALSASQNLSPSDYGFRPRT